MFWHDYICLWAFIIVKVTLLARSLYLHNLIIDYTQAMINIIMRVCLGSHIIGLHIEYECILSKGASLTIQHLLDFILVFHLLELYLLRLGTRKAKIPHNLPSIALYILGVHKKYLWPHQYFFLICVAFILQLFLIFPNVRVVDANNEKVLH